MHNFLQEDEKIPKAKNSERKKKKDDTKETHSRDTHIKREREKKRRVRETVSFRAARAGEVLRDAARSC